MATFSFAFYVVTMGVGWALNQNVYPGNSLILGGAVVSTIPVFAVLGYAYSARVCGMDNALLESIGGCILVVQCAASVFEVIGGILFIAAGATLKEENPNILAYGVSAGVFSILAGITCCCAQCCCCMAICGKNSDSKSNTTGESYEEF